MPATKELTLQLEDRPGTLGKICRALADRGVNILALQSVPTQDKSLVRIIADNPTTAKTVLDVERVPYTETDVAQAKLPHRPGELALAATRLGESNININYVYCGIEPASNSPLVIFGVADVARAVAVLEKAVSAAA